MTKTILYIEDNEDNATIAEKILLRAGYIVHIAWDGPEGIAMVEDCDPDLIICDYHLPEMNGPQVIEHIRSIDKVKDIPIIMYTADIYTRTSSIDAGANAYLNKPIRRNQLVSTIESLLVSND